MNYKSPKQTVLFSMPFEQQLDSKNRWVLLSQIIPWDKIDSIYRSGLKTGQGSGGALSSRLIVGAMIIKHKENLSDERTVEYITENPYAQYFIGQSAFSTAVPFDASLLTIARKRIDWQSIEGLLEELLQIEKPKEVVIKEEQKEKDDDDKNGNVGVKGEMILDSTVIPQDIRYPTDVNLLNESRKFTEQLIRHICKVSGQKPPRTYCQIASKAYHAFIKKGKPNRKTIRKVLRQQLGFVRRNLKHLSRLLVECQISWHLLFTKRSYKKYLVVQEVFRQQEEMYTGKTRSCKDRIVNLNQPHIRPIVRGKQPISTEFGAKLDVFVDSQGYKHLHKMEWDASNDSQHLQSAAEFYRKRFGVYPERIKADTQYRSKANRAWCKERGIILSGRGAGRPSKEAAIKDKPGERNAIEGLFGHCKQHKGLARVKAKLKASTEVWIVMVLLVINLEKYLANTFLGFIRTLRLKIKLSRSSSDALTASWNHFYKQQQFKSYANKLLIRAV
jgi:transposase, IS5 family